MQNYSAACRSTLRKGSAFPELSLLISFLRLSLRKQKGGWLTESHRLSALCGGKPRVSGCIQGDLVYGLDGYEETT